MANAYRNENYDSDSEDSDDKSSRYYTDDEYSDELSDTKKQSSNESSGDDRKNVSSKVEYILSKGLAEIEIRPMGRRKNDESENILKKTTKPQKPKKSSGVKIKDINSLTPPSPSTSFVTQYSICAASDFTIYSPSIASPFPLIDNFQTTDSPLSNYDGSITSEEATIQSFSTNMSTDSTIQQFSQNLIENHSDSSFYPNILNNLDILDNYTPDLEEIEKLCKELESEENKKTCIYEICLMKPDDFFETINYKDEDGNLLLHHMARLRTMKHKLSDIMTMTINPNLKKDENGFVEIETLYFTEAIISRASRSEKPGNIKNLINQSNKNNETPLMIAIKEDRLDMLKLFYPYARLELRKEPFAHTCLHLACMNGSVECFQFLKQEYYSKRENICFIDQCDSLGNTPLMLAIKFFSDKNPSNYRTIIQDLIKMGRFDLNAQNNDGDRLVHLVSKNGFCPPNTKINILLSLKITKYDLTFKQHFNSKSAVDLWVETPINNQYNALQFINACVNSQNSNTIENYFFN